MSRRSLFNSPPREWRLTSILMLLGSGLCLPYSAMADDETDVPTTTPIKHVVVSFQENRSFDQYFATYPFAANLPGETPFHGKQGTPRVNGLVTAGLLTANPNSALASA